jgi:two-component sensor histidine kinase
MDLSDNITPPKITLRYVGIAIAITFFANSLIGLLFAATYSVFNLDALITDLVYSHCIGWLMLIFLLGGRHLIWPRTGPSSLGLFALALFGGAAAWIFGNYLGAAINGQPPFLMAKFGASRMIPGLVMTSLGAIIGTVYFRNREHLAILKVKAEQQALAAETAQRQLIGAQLTTLQAQLEPHMLFNTLANLRALIGIDPGAAQLMLDKLNSFLRATLSSTRQKEITLAQEFQLVNDYLDLMKIRLSFRLNFELNLPAALRDTVVPPLLLQPLVENAIKHGIEPFTDNGFISVTAKRSGEMLQLLVIDTSNAKEVTAPFSAKEVRDNQGFGLTQLKERLTQLYGDKAILNVSFRDRENSQTTVEIYLPC